MAWVYILKGDRYYVGSTPKLIGRLKDHRRGNTHTTKRIGHWKLARVIFCCSLFEARKLEMKIKRSKNIKRWAEYDNRLFELE
jgi:predicted GIY-YIG superfamily endonuclease